MSYNQEHIELTENIINNSPGFRGNEDLKEEMLNETLKRSQSFIESSMDPSSLEIYIKKIAGNVIVDILKEAEKIRATKEKSSQGKTEFIEVPISYETDTQGKIIYEIELPVAETPLMSVFNSEKISNIKQKINELDNKNSKKHYKQIFELRFVKELTVEETAQKLEMEEMDVSNALIEIFKEIDSL